MSKKDVNLHKPGDQLFHFKLKQCYCAGPLGSRYEVYNEENYISYYEASYQRCLGCFQRTENLSAHTIMKDKISSFDFEPSGANKCFYYGCCMFCPCCPKYKTAHVWSSSGLVTEMVIDIKDFDSCLQYLRDVTTSGGGAPQQMTMN